MGTGAERSCSTSLSCAYVPELLPVALPLEAALLTGEDGAAAWRDRMGDLREAIRLAVEPVAEAGRLAPGWSVEGATDWIWARVQPTAWQHLVGERGWSPAEYDERLIESILGEVVAPSPSGS
jgi:hypothetical protein